MKAIKPDVKIKKPQFLNPDKMPLTAERFLEFPGCSSYSKEEALAIVQSLHSLSHIFVELHRNKDTLIDNQYVVNLNKDTEITKVISLNSKSKAA